MPEFCSGLSIKNKMNEKHPGKEDSSPRNCAADLFNRFCFVL
jgi:hypothetical protein